MPSLNEIIKCASDITPTYFWWSFLGAFLLFNVLQRTVGDVELFLKYVSPESLNTTKGRLLEAVLFSVCGALVASLSEPCHGFYAFLLGFSWSSVIGIIPLAFKGAMK